MGDGTTNLTLYEIVYIFTHYSLREVFPITDVQCQCTVYGYVFIVVKIDQVTRYFRIKNTQKYFDDVFSLRATLEDK